MDRLYCTYVYICDVLYSLTIVFSLFFFVYLHTFIWIKANNSNLYHFHYMFFNTCKCTRKILEMQRNIPNFKKGNIIYFRDWLGTWIHLKAKYFTYIDKYTIIVGVFLLSFLKTSCYSHFYVFKAQLNYDSRTRRFLRDRTYNCFGDNNANWMNLSHANCFITYI